MSPFHPLRTSARIQAQFSALMKEGGGAGRRKDSKMLRKLILVGALAGSTALIATPAEARCHHRHGYHWCDGYSRYSYGYSPYSYGYSYPRYSYGYSPYGYTYPSYGYRSYGYPYGYGQRGYYYNHRRHERDDDDDDE